MEVFPADAELCYYFNDNWNNDEVQLFEEERKQQIDFYNQNVMDPFFSQAFGFKLDDIKPSIVYVAQFFTMPFDCSTQPDISEEMNKQLN